MLVGTLWARRGCGSPSSSAAVEDEARARLITPGRLDRSATPRAADPDTLVCSERTIGDGTPARDVFDAKTGDPALRLATLIISLILSLVVFLQSCAAAIGGSLGEEFGESRAEITEAEDLSAAAGFGVLAGFLWIIGAGLVIARPKASMWLYGVAALFLLIAGTAGYTDGYIWAGASAIFALMSWRGIGERREKEERDRARYQADLAAAASAMKQRSDEA